MRTYRAPDSAWVRASLLVPTSVTVIAGLFVVSGRLFESGQHGLGDTLAYVDWTTLLLAVFLGPAWVTHDLPTPPRNDGPPRGKIVPFPTHTPLAADTPDTGGNRSDHAARVTHLVPVRAISPR